MRAAATDLAWDHGPPLVNPVAERGAVHHSALRRNRRLQRLEALLADAGDLLKLVDRLEAAMLIAVLDDPLRERRPDPIEDLELRLRRARQADPCAGGAPAWNSARCNTRGSTARGAPAPAPPPAATPADPAPAGPVPADPPPDAVAADPPAPPTPAA